MKTYARDPDSLNVWMLNGSRRTLKFWHGNMSDELQAVVLLSENGQRGDIRFRHEFVPIMLEHYARPPHEITDLEIKVWLQCQREKVQETARPERRLTTFSARGGVRQPC